MGTHYVGDRADVSALDAFIKLRRATNRLDYQLATKMRKCGLTEPQFGIMEAIYHLGPLRQTDLAKKILRSGGNITFVIDKLESMGFVKRVAMESDRRCSEVHLTRSGTTRIKQVFPGHVQVISQLMSRLTLEEQSELGRLCKKLGNDTIRSLEITQGE